MVTAAVAALAVCGGVAASALGSPRADAAVALLIALLELARVGAISLSQPVPFGPIVVFRATAHEAA